jgi:putrescine importer
MEQKSKLRRTLGMWPMVMLGLGYLTPAVVFDTFGIALRDTKGHVPTAYLITLLAMMFTAVSYGKMVKAYSSSGSAYSYTQKTIGPHVGFMVGWLSLLDYLLLPLINVLLAQQYLNVIFPNSPGWVWIFLITGIVTFINIRGIQSTARVNSMFVYFQIAIILAFIILCIRGLLDGLGIGEVISAKPFYNQNFDVYSIINGATILCFSFLGFDAVSNYAEEAVNPKKDVPRAIMLTAVLGGGLFVITSYFTQLTCPDISMFKNIENSTAADISLYVGGRFFQLLFLAASFVGVFASGLASHASVSRLLYVMGRDRVLPKNFFGNLSDRFQTPIYSILFVGVVCILALFLTMETAVHFISFGSLVAFSFVNISVIAHYVFKHKMLNSLTDIIFNLIFPMIGLSIIFILWANIKSVALITGLSWGGIGLVYLLFLKTFVKLDFHETRLRSIAENDSLKPSAPIA